jgi:hypothetical protein
MVKKNCIILFVILGFTLFFDEDFRKAFEKITKLKNTPDKLYISNVKEFLHYTFNFPPLDDEVQGKNLIL